MRYHHAAFYSFTPLDHLPALREQWLAALRGWDLQGTIILAHEGLNGFLAGSAEGVAEALAFFRSMPALANLRVKESVCERKPFAKLCIKLKKEIVTFRVPELSPPASSTQRLSPAELAAWYAEGRDFIALDTRNEFEARLGTFRGAVSLGLHHLVDFRAAAAELPESWKQKPVVTFCTGGIRCEKAAPFLETLGFQNVFQLEDGILGYLEAVGGEHWQGECFVFDERVALGPDLQPTGAFLCGHCQWPVRRGEVCAHCAEEQALAD